MTGTPPKKESKRTEKEDDELWQKLKIYFNLDAKIFTDNKIEGTIKVEPKEARELIEEFEVIIDDSNAVKCASDFGHISVSGFQPKKEDSCVLIKAKPKHVKLVPMESERYTFSIIRQSPAFSLTVSLKWPNNQKTPNLIIEWHHIGDSAAQQYAIVLDDKEIYYIRDTSIGTIYKVCIDSFPPDKKPTEHTIQIKARLNTGEAKYKSDIVKFTTPIERSQQSIQVLNVSGDTYVDDNSAEDEASQDQKPSSPKKDNQPKSPSPKCLTSSTLQQKDNQKSDTTSTKLSCGCQEPHETFPGIDHYLDTKH